VCSIACGRRNLVAPTAAHLNTSHRVASRCRNSVRRRRPTTTTSQCFQSVKQYVMCLCRSNGTGVVVRRRVVADARLPVAILLPVSPPSSSSPPSPTVTTFVLFVTLCLTAVSCSSTVVTDSVDGTKRTGSSKRVGRVSEVDITTFGDRLTTTDFDEVVESSHEVKSETTTEQVEQSTSVDIHVDGNSQFPQMPDTQLQQTTVESRHFRSSTAPEVTLDNIFVSTWSRLHRRQKTASATSSFLTSTSNVDFELTTMSQSSAENGRLSATESERRSSSSTLDFSSETSTSSSEGLTETMTTFGGETGVTETLGVTPAAANVEFLLAETTHSNLETAVDSKPDRVGGSVDGFDAGYIRNTKPESNRRRGDSASERLKPTTKSADRTANRTTSRRGDRNRCLQMRTGGGDSLPPMDCYQDSVDDDDGGGNGPSGTTDRRSLEFCDAYSAYVGDFDCAPSSSCLEFLCPEVVRLDRLAQSMNNQFADKMVKYDCEHHHSHVRNCSECKVTTSSYKPPLHGLVRNTNREILRAETTKLKSTCFISRLVSRIELSCRRKTERHSAFFRNVPTSKKQM